MSYFDESGCGRHILMPSLLLKDARQVRDHNSRMPVLPILQTRYDENGIPVSAKCSLCGQHMLQGTPRITDPIEKC